MARINKVGHVVLNVQDVEASIRFYRDVLSMEVVSTVQEPHMAFLSFGPQHHDIALMEAAEGAQQGGIGLNHIALEIEGGIDELKLLYQKLLDHEVRIFRLADHVHTKSVYFYDPDNNLLEIFADVLGHEAGKEFLRTGGADKPLTFETSAIR